MNAAELDAVPTAKDPTDDAMSDDDVVQLAVAFAANPFLM